MAHYILQVIVFQLLFLAVYVFALKNETFFTYNRIYLLATAVISFTLPFMQFDVINEQIPTVFRMQLPAVFIGNAAGDANIIANTLGPVFITQDVINWQAVLLTIYGLGAIVSLVFFLFKLQKIYRFQKQGSIIKSDGYRVCLLPQSKQAFTFLSTIYLGKQISEVERVHIIAHEQVHIDQRHTLDLLFFEALKIVFWFNPAIYFYQKQLRALHEFTADYKIAKKDKSEYYQRLLSQVFGTTSISFINTFFNHSLIKKRIIMLQKSKSNRVFTLKYLLILPLVVGMLIYTSCNNESSNSEDTEVMQKITELSEAIMKVGELTDDESNALKLLTTEAGEGDKIYLSVEEYLKDINEEGVPLSTLDAFPIYPGCEGDIAENKKCFSESITKFIVNNFNTKMGEDSNISGKQRIVANFKINKIGLVQDIKIISDHEKLSNEALRVVRLLPKMKPGIKNDKTVNVLYSLPILFKIES